MYKKRMQKNKGKEVLGKAMRIKAAVDTGGMSEVVRGAKNVLGKPGQERRKARRAARKAKRAAKYGGGTAMKKTMRTPYKHGGTAMKKAKPC